MPSAQCQLGANTIIIIITVKSGLRMKQPALETGRECVILRLPTSNTQNHTRFSQDRDHDIQSDVERA